MGKTNAPAQKSKGLFMLRARGITGQRPGRRMEGGRSVRGPEPTVSKMVLVKHQACWVYINKYNALYASDALIM